MIPLQLTIEGLYSYQKRQVIDFRNLTEAGLFGIFGQVGSGKSSILEAISYVLYGETERLNAKDRRAYNMMNLKSNRSYIEFDFINSESRKFRAVREFKRNSKRFDDVKSPTVMFYEEKDGNWLPLGHSDAEKIIGLSYDNFKRTIIIPQGQFREFLELGASDRTKMMKEIFNLHQYDLYDKSTVLMRKNQSELDVLQGKLSGFEEVSPEILSALKTQVDQEKEALFNIQREFESMNETFQQLKMLKNDFENLRLKKTDFEKLLTRKEEMDMKKEQLEHYEKVFQAFHQLLVDEKRIHKEIDSRVGIQKDQSAQLAKLQQHFNETEAQIEKLRPDFEVLAQNRTAENDLNLIVSILGFKKEIGTLKLRTEQGQKEVEKVGSLVLSLENEIKNNENEIRELNAKRTDSKLLMEVDRWFSKHNSLCELLEKQNEKVSGQKKNYSDISEKLEFLKISEEHFETDFRRKIEKCETERKHFEQLRNQLEVQQKLAQYAHNLHDGEKCPLCGATEHPEIAEPEDVTAHLQHSRNEIIRMSNRISELQEEFVQAKNLLSQKEIFKHQLSDEEAQCKLLQEEIGLHKKAFVWSEFRIEEPEDFERKKQDALKIEKEIEAKNHCIFTKRNELEVERKKYEGYRKHLENFKLQEVHKETQISQNKVLLKVLQFDEFAGAKEENVRQQLLEMKKKNDLTERNFNALISEINMLNPKLSEKRAGIKILEEQIENLNKESGKVHNLLVRTLAEQKIVSLDKVRETLASLLDTRTLRREIEDFTITFETLKNNIAELEARLKDVSFDETTFLATEEKLTSLTAKLKFSTEKVTKTLAEKERLTKAFETKKDLLNQQNQLQKRAENLRIMGNLFKGAGFVQYVSSIYLRQLCDHANVRFHRMTRSQLSLHLNENNDFEIVDYLNEGKSRSVKTLSGGQAFQVSLSLALALAESVQSSAKAEKNFFFIDEGFGTQDLESVNVVFETLMNLQKENRIVGIISHVEELKERIPVALNIVKDEEKGSLIEII